MPDDIPTVSGRPWELREIVDPGPVVTKNGREVPAHVASMLATRGIQNIANWSMPTFADYMPDPHVLGGMKEAAELLVTAALAKRPIAILGDYDVDGATSSAIVVRWMRQLGFDAPTVYIPDRMQEGYGPNKNAISQLRNEGNEVLLLLDSGTVSLEPIAHARDIGFEVIVVDHHEPLESGVLPEAIVVNPKLPETQGGVPELAILCTAGLAFLLVVACNRLVRARAPERLAGFNVNPLLGLTALGTVADVMQLQGLNRAYVKLGLKDLDTVPGILALKRLADTEDNSVRVCGFVVGPAINAGGRIDRTWKGWKLLAEDDEQEAAAKAKELHDINQERKKVQDVVLTACVKQVETLPAPLPRSLVLYDEAWHPGVVGIVAGRLRDRYGVSAVVAGEGGKGSARAAPGFNIGQAFLRAVELGILYKGGGHGVAAGMTMLPENHQMFQVYLEDLAQQAPIVPIHPDFRMDPGEVSMDFIRSFDVMEPVGVGNPHPRFLMTGGTLKNVALSRNQEHIFANLVSRKGVMRVALFGGAGTPLGKALLEADGARVDLLGTCRIDSWREQERLQMIVEDLRYPEGKQAQQGQLFAA